jgi:hypothetical protein
MLFIPRERRPSLHTDEMAAAEQTLASIHRHKTSNMALRHLPHPHRGLMFLGGHSHRGTEAEYAVQPLSNVR